MFFLKGVIIMPSKKPKLGMALLALAVVCVILKLLISWLFPLSRLLLILLVPVTIICFVVFLIANRQVLKNGRVLTCLLVPLLVVTFTLLPIDSQLEFARFHVMKGNYESSVREVNKNISASDTTIDGQAQLQFPQTIATPYGFALYYKMGKSVAILFPASETLSIVRYYGYFSDSTARNMIQYPHDYKCNWGEVDRIDELDGPQWGYVLTWGEGNMVPKDPYL